MEKRNEIVEQNKTNTNANKKVNIETNKLNTQKNETNIAKTY